MYINRLISTIKANPLTLMFSLSLMQWSKGASCVLQDGDGLIA
jgi:hypothetical protein